MSENYNLLLEKLKILKRDYCALGLKLELETEIISTAELDLAKQLAGDSNLELILKTCGCSAVSDIFLAKALSINSLLSPMIESAYALDKFYQNVKNIFDEGEKPKLMFNLETVTAYKNLDEILSYENIDKFDTVVFGRSDFCSSLGLSIQQCDSEEIFSYVSNVSDKIEKTNLDMVIGGNVTKKTFDFLNKVQTEKFRAFETRKIVFDKEVLKKNYEKALNLALEFEILWLESKSFKNPLDEQRRQILNKRIV